MHVIKIKSSKIPKSLLYLLGIFVVIYILRDFVTLIFSNMFYNITVREDSSCVDYYILLFYMIIGLLSGFYYRELTKAHHFTGDTQLALVHTHTLILECLCSYFYYHLKRYLN